MNLRANSFRVSLLIHYLPLTKVYQRMFCILGENELFFSHSNSLEFVENVLICITGKIVSSPDNGELRLVTNFHDTSNIFPTNVHTMEVSKRLEVDFQQMSIPWKCPKGSKLTSNKCPYHGSVQKVGSIMEICWKRTRFFQCGLVKSYPNERKHIHRRFWSFA